jgi:hypothetical protein
MTTVNNHKDDAAAGSSSTADDEKEKLIKEDGRKSPAKTPSFCFENMPLSGADEDSDENTNNDHNRMMMTTQQRQRHFMRRQSSSTTTTKSLSMRFIKSLSGLGCENCKTDPFHNIMIREGTSAAAAAAAAATSSSSSSFMIDGGLYNLKSLQKSLSTISPLVSGPMMLDHNTPVTTATDTPASPSTTTVSISTTIEQVIGEYMCFCRFYNVNYNAGILTTLRFALPCLRVTGSFHDEDMLALVELLLRHGNTSLKYITRLDFTIASKEGRHWRNTKLVGFTSHGALALAKALQTTKYVKEVFLQRHRIGPYGASAIFLACRTNPTIEAINLRRCRIGERGAFAFCEIIMGVNPMITKQDNENDNTATTASGGTEFLGHGLIDVDLSANRIGHQGTNAIERAIERRLANDKEHPIFVNMEGNLVFPEVSGWISVVQTELLILFFFSFSLIKDSFI